MLPKCGFASAELVGASRTHQAKIAREQELKIVPDGRCRTRAAPTANANSVFFFRSAIFQIYVRKAKLVVDVVNLQHGIRNSKSGCRKQKLIDI
jgi:hypothetical protein